MSNFSTHQKETKNERAFKAMDANGDGFVTRAEFKKACKALKPEQVIIRFRRGPGTGTVVRFSAFGDSGS